MNQRVYYNGLWVFGDSYSAKAGLADNEDLRKFYKKHHVKDWAELLSDELQAPLQRKAMGGAGIGWIMNELIHTLPYMKPNDIVVISDTMLTRLEGYDKRTDEIKTLDNERIFYKEPTEEDNHLVPVRGERNQDIVNKYTIEFIYNNYEAWEKYYIEQLKSINRLLSDRFIELYFWSHRLWDTQELTRFSRIEEETDGLIHDAHWGMVGHQEFFKYIYTRIKNKEYFDI